MARPRVPLPWDSRPRVPLPWDSRPPIPTPDQTKYGPPRPVPVRDDRVKSIGYTDEAGGTAALCHGCGWELWAETHREAAAKADEHTCPKRKGAAG